MKRAIDIVEPGTHTTVQDRGRPGLLGSGVSVGGAVDHVSLRIANLLVGNDENAAALECAAIGPTIRFRHACVIAFCGAASAGVPSAQSIRVRARDTLRIGPLRTRAYGYLAIAGGVDVPVVLGSRSTDARVGIGGFNGRLLAASDSISICEQLDSGAFGLRANTSTAGDDLTPIRVLPSAFANRADSGWMQREFRVSSKSNRMGIRLECSPIASTSPATAESTIVLPGTIQLPPGGEPIVQLADAQTLGGYEQIGHVIAADLPRLAQSLPGTIIRFEAVTLEEAHRLLRQQTRQLAFLRYALSLRR